MALDSCNIQSSPRSSTVFENEPKSKVKKKTNGHAKLNGKTPSNGTRKTSSNGVHKTSSNGVHKTSSNGVHKTSSNGVVDVNGIHGNSKPIPYVPTEPSPNSAAVPSGIVSTRSGECTTCGRKHVLVSAPPMSRCVDYVSCETVRKAMGLLRSGKPIPATKPAIVCTIRHGVEYYFKKVLFKKRELRASEIVEAPLNRAPMVLEEVVGEALELVRERKEATKFPPDQANQLASIWGAVAREV